MNKQNDLAYSPEAFAPDDNLVMFESETWDDPVQTMTMNRREWEAMGEPSIITVTVGPSEAPATND